MQPVSTRGWTLDELLQQGKRFYPVPRLSCTSQDLESQIKHHEESGKPFVIEGWNQHSRWPKKLFDVDFCGNYFQAKNEKITVRNVHTRMDKAVLFDEFVEKSRTMPPFAVPDETERWYGKDVECPQQWEEWLVKGRVLPEKFLPGGNDDLFAHRPKKNDRPDVETLMCYFGVADTYTPCHKDLCASSGQNLMCYTEKGGTSFWFMTKSRDCPKVAKYFQSLKQELDFETHVLSLSELSNAPFDVYITEQKLGDLVLVPPRSCHQVVNSGGITIKMSWSRMTLAGLTAALYHELPLYRRVCRPEIYQIKSTIHYTLVEYTENLKALISQPYDSIEKGAIIKQLKAVLRLYDTILLEECSRKGSSLGSGRELPDSDSVVKGAALPLAEDFHACDFCGADIFQNYFQCLGESDSSPGEYGFIVCPGCYVEGRTCDCTQMREKERQNFNVFFTARWRALQALAGAGQSVNTFKGSGSLEEQTRYFAKPSRRSLFHAAMLLNQIRLGERQPTRSCRVKGESHSVPSAWAQNCKKCHSSRCYPDLMEISRMHSVTALLLTEQDSSSMLYHEEHMRKFPEYHEGKKDLIRSQFEGTAYPDFRVLLVFNVFTYPTCQPIKHEHASLGCSPLSSVTGGDSDRDELTSDDENFNHPLHRRGDPGSSIKKRKFEKAEEPVDDGGHSTAAKESELEPSSIRGVKKPSIVKPPFAKSQSAKQEVDDAGSSSAIPIGPPKKKRRQEPQQNSQAVTSGEPSSSNEPNAFALSLGAAINQVAETATKTRPSGVNQDHRRKHELAKSRPGDSTALGPLEIASSTSQQFKQAPQTPILVNASELQDMIVQTTDRVVRQMIGSVPHALLAAHAAVSMMSGYAAAGQFVNHFAEASTPSHVTGNNAMNSQGSAPSNQPQLSTSNSRETVDDHRHQHNSKDRDGARASYRSKSEKRTESVHPSERHHLPPVVRKTASKEGSRRRQHEDDDDDDDD
ncbi:hypothetical protein AN958_08684 [Leucoagaricus sp. SymC.cos]|nr:hypothetical protein AN958_08684 [Leucoagaricus sp. SymC.cos]